MVVYFDCVDPAYGLFMGKDKFENEDLIKWGWPEDIWFHVSSLSSAHIYLRLPKGVTVETIPADVIKDAVQLTKANSIEGCKRDQVDIVYTPWANLRKTQGMDVSLRACFAFFFLLASQHMNVMLSRI
jgi:predicted ribosome quality control (RQC) complex YloA/Tae2 family protein